MTVGYESGQICLEMTERLVTIFKSQEEAKKSTKPVSQARCLQILIENTIFSAIAREIKQKEQEKQAGVYIAYIDHFPHPSSEHHFSPRTLTRWKKTNPPGFFGVYVFF